MLVQNAQITSRSKFMHLYFLPLLEQEQSVCILFERCSFLKTILIFDHLKKKMRTVVDQNERPTYVDLRLTRVYFGGIEI